MALYGPIVVVSYVSLHPQDMTCSISLVIEMGSCVPWNLIKDVIGSSPDSSNTKRWNVALRSAANNLGIRPPRLWWWQPRWKYYTPQWLCVGEHAILAWCVCVATWTGGLRCLLRNITDITVHALLPNGEALQAVSLIKHTTSHQHMTYKCVALHLLCWFIHPSALSLLHSKRMLPLSFTLLWQTLKSLLKS